MAGRSGKAVADCKRTECDLPYLPVHEVEAAVEAQWRREQIASPIIERTYQRITADLEILRKVASKTRRQIQGRIAALENQRVVYAEKSAAGVIPDDVARSKHNDLTVRLVRAQADLARHEAVVSDIDEDLRIALDLAAECGDAYDRADDTLRRDWNQAWFEWLRVDDGTVSEAKHTPPIGALLDGVGMYGRPGPAKRPGKRNEAPTGHLVGKSTTGVLIGVASKENYLVELMGIEPTTSTMPSWRSSN